MKRAWRRHRLHSRSWSFGPPGQQGRFGLAEVAVGRRTITSMNDRRSQEERSAESREKLIVAAIELLGTQGYAGTSLAAIGTRAGLSRGLVSHHFGSKEQCVVEVMKYIRRIRSEAAVRRINARGLAGLDAFLDMYLLDDTGEAIESARAVLTVLVEASTASPGLREICARHNARLRESMAIYLRDAVDMGEIPAGDVNTLTVVIEGIMRGVMLQTLVDESAVDVRAAAELTKQLIRAAVGAQAGTVPAA